MINNGHIDSYAEPKVVESSNSQDNLSSLTIQDLMNYNLLAFEANLSMRGSHMFGSWNKFGDCTKYPVRVTLHCTMIEGSHAGKSVDSEARISYSDYAGVSDAELQKVADKFCKEIETLVNQEYNTRLENDLSSYTVWDGISYRVQELSTQLTTPHHVKVANYKLERNNDHNEKGYYVDTYTLTATKKSDNTSLGSLTIIVEHSVDSGNQLMTDIVTSRGNKLFEKTLNVNTKSDKAIDDYNSYIKFIARTIYLNAFKYIVDAYEKKNGALPE